VNIRGAEFSLDTDEDGQAYSDEIPAGTREIEISFPGYETQLINSIDITADNEIQKVIQLKVSGSSMEIGSE